MSSFIETMHLIQTTALLQTCKATMNEVALNPHILQRDKVSGDNEHVPKTTQSETCGDKVGAESKQTAWKGALGQAERATACVAYQLQEEPRLGALDGSVRARLRTG